MPMTMRQTLAQIRSKEAWDYAVAAKAALGGAYKEYVNLVKKLPAQISDNGLGHTLAFLAAKGKAEEDSAEGLLYQQLEKWLTQKHNFNNPYRAPYGSETHNNEAAGNKFRLIRLIHQNDTTHYRWATAEALNFIAWLKSYADSLEETPAATPTIGAAVVSEPPASVLHDDVAGDRSAAEAGD